MTTKFYKSLDRKFDFFGLKGKWITISLVAIGSSIVIGIISGFFLSSGLGTFVAIALAVASFVGCLVLQASYSSRDLEKLTTQGKVKYTVVRRETLSRLLLENSEFEKAKSEGNGKDRVFLYRPIKEHLKKIDYDRTSA